jgi:chloride channel 7
VYVQVMFFSLAVLTYGTAVPSGQFVPGIMIGATYGRLVGILVVNASSKDSVDEGTYVLGTFNCLVSHDTDRRQMGH